MERQAKDRRRAPSRSNFEVSDTLSEFLTERKQERLAGKKKDRNYAISRRGIENADESEDRVYHVMLNNIPHTVDSETLLQFVVDRTGIDRSKVLSCDFSKRPRRRNKSPGQIHLVLSGGAQVKKIQNSAQDRKLGSLEGADIDFYIRSTPPRNLPADQAPGEKSYSLNRFTLGEQDGPKSFVMRWGIPDLLPGNGRQRGAAKKFVFHCQSEQLSWSFTYNGRSYEFCVARNQLQSKMDIDQSRENYLELTISLRNPPEVWQLNGYRRRIGDFTGYDVIGELLIYHLELTVSTEERADLLKKLAHYGLCKDPRVPSSHEPLFESSRREVISSANPVLFPVVEDLKFEVRYALEVLISKGTLARSLLGSEFYEYLKRLEPSGHAVPALKAMGAQPSSAQRSLIIEPRKELKKWLQVRTDPSRRRIKLPNWDREKANPPEGRVRIRRVTITPTRKFVHQEEVQNSNRVLRENRTNQDRFLRVSFRDDNFRSFPSDGRELMQRKKKFLGDGFSVAGRSYHLLGFTESQLGEASAWFFANTDGPAGVTAESIRGKMGDFSSMPTPGMYAARMGQCFSSTFEGVHVRQHQWKIIEDVERNGYCFSDGCGIISEGLAKKLAKKIKAEKPFPSAYQIRFNGAKGMVSVWPDNVLQQYSPKNSGVQLLIRKSMNKFEVEHNKLEVLEASKFHSAYLNRQIITVLSTRGVLDTAFMRLQEDMLNFLRGIFASRDRALDLRDSALGLVLRMSQGEGHSGGVIDMIKAGFHVAREPFLRESLSCLTRQRLRTLERRSKIFVPQAANLFGVMDETDTLEYGEVFIAYRSRDTDYKKRVLDDTDVVVGKNPTLHPGDFRVLRARGRNVPEALKNIENCIVFPSRGPRPHPDECSGGDLDGDRYFVSWDPQLIPTGECKPMDYASTERAEKASTVTIEDVIDFFVNYPSKDDLGKIANAYLANADLSEQKAYDPKCLKLAELHSTAVDYKKKGVPARMENWLYPKSYPDFMQGPHTPTHPSEKVIGEMHRQVKKSSREFANDMSARGRVTEISILPSDEDFDNDLKIPGHEQYVDECIRHLKKYQCDLIELMEKFGVNNEVELLTSTVHHFGCDAGEQTLFSDTWKQANIEVGSLRLEHERYFKHGLASQPDRARGLSDADKEDERELLRRASANYVVAYKRAAKAKSQGRYQRKETRGLLSFPWIASGRQLCAIKRSAGSQSSKSKR